MARGPESEEESSLFTLRRYLCTCVVFSYLGLNNQEAFSFFWEMEFGKPVTVWAPQNGSSYAVVWNTLTLEPGQRVGFSFRTCAPGELLKQTGDSLDQLTVSLLRDQGRLHVRVHGDDRIADVLSDGDLLDGLWHAVALEVSADRSGITLEVDGARTESSPADAEVIRNLNLSSSSDGLRVGTGMVACVREGPGVRFTKAGVTVNSDAVGWGGCLLPYDCQGRNRKCRIVGGGWAKSATHVATSRIRLSSIFKTTAVPVF